MGYDASPFKVRPCSLDDHDCLDNPHPKVYTRDLADPQVELPETASGGKPDHWHVMPRGGGDNRGARDLQKWTTIALSTTRCEHGRIQLDRCFSCPDGYSPSRAGQQIGHYLDGQPVVIPVRDKANDPSEWFLPRSR